jgi:hypothetical protein
LSLVDTWLLGFVVKDCRTCISCSHQVCWCGMESRCWLHGKNRLLSCNGSKSTHDHNHSMATGNIGHYISLLLHLLEANWSIRACFWRCQFCTDC